VGELGGVKPRRVTTKIAEIEKPIWPPMNTDEKLVKKRANEGGWPGPHWFSQFSFFYRSSSVFIGGSQVFDP
jgi:hypothetical protein